MSSQSASKQFFCLVLELNNLIVQRKTLDSFKDWSTIDRFIKNYNYLIDDFNLRSNCLSVLSNLFQSINFAINSKMNNMSSANHLSTIKNAHLFKFLINCYLKFNILSNKFWFVLIVCFTLFIHFHSTDILLTL
ncbi:uncharacterized protein ASCRUDRAFT_77795 [Ascoidea rubescens DSM 1968]|uniref:Uncharacterized protein n=1 Tax=Ascoidea rubescens DSM 1968 TaxID=1344418 RepID=A0A1D2VAR3_9ASCO|nr:hypothetical protein ASCRUDRAFT_77795 [Ascoidea rubescens DSM 1968]ODV58543.1 hypothetical protein ASCRUDRAFT_77795 [Ascoidea rubescens DSM 1968]